MCGAADKEVPVFEVDVDAARWVDETSVKLSQFGGLSFMQCESVTVWWFELDAVSKCDSLVV